MRHELMILHKVGAETGIALQSASCACGWKANIWYASIVRVGESYGRHLDAVETGSDVPWMVAPRSVA